MVEKNVMLAKAYYQAMNEKDFSAVEKYWHSDARLITPFGERKGKDAILPAVKDFMSSFTTLVIRASFGSEHQAMLVVDLEYPLPVGILRSAVLMTFKDDLIMQSELFFDTQPFMKK